MTTNHVTKVSLSRRATRVMAGVMCASALAVLTACGSSKPKPAPLEAFKPSASVKTAWSYKGESAQAPVSLALADGRVVSAGTGGNIVALDASTGKVVWQAQAKGSLSAAVGSDGRYAAVINTHNELQVFEHGKASWSARLPGRVITAPLVAGERVFVQSVDRSVRGYDALDGRWLWQYQRAGSEALALATSGAMATFRDTLLVGQGSRLVGLEPTVGSVRFDVNVGTPRGTNEVERLADLIGPIARVDDEVCVRAFQLSVACLELNRGSLRWSRPQAGAQGVAANERLVVGADASDRLTAWKIENGDVLWRVDRFTNRGLSAPAVLGDHVFVVDAEGYLHLLSATDGRTLARVELDSPAAAAPVAASPFLYVVTKKGTVYALRAN